MKNITITKVADLSQVVGADVVGNDLRGVPTRICESIKGCSGTLICTDEDDALFLPDDRTRHAAVKNEFIDEGWELLADCTAGDLTGPALRHHLGLYGEGESGESGESIEARIRELCKALSLAYVDESRIVYYVGRSRVGDLYYRETGGTRESEEYETFAEAKEALDDIIRRDYSDDEDWGRESGIFYECKLEAEQTLGLEDVKWDALPEDELREKRIALEKKTDALFEARLATMTEYQTDVYNYFIVAERGYPEGEPTFIGIVQAEVANA